MEGGEEDGWMDRSRDGSRHACPPLGRGGGLGPLGRGRPGAPGWGRRADSPWVGTRQTVSRGGGRWRKKGGDEEEKEGLRRNFQSAGHETQFGKRNIDEEEV